MVTKINKLFDFETTNYKTGIALGGSFRVKLIHTDEKKWRKNDRHNTIMELSDSVFHYQKSQLLTVTYHHHMPPPKCHIHNHEDSPSTPSAIPSGKVLHNLSIIFFLSLFFIYDESVIYLIKT